MGRAARRFSIVSAALLLTLSAMPLALAWTPPPPEFVDVALLAGLDAALPKWGPDLGPSTSILDALPHGSPAAGDFNRDGYPDLFVPVAGYADPAMNAGTDVRSRLYFNDGSSVQDERFLDVTDVSGIAIPGGAFAASWADYDNDGFPDLFVGGFRLARLYHNEGDGTFTDATASAGLPGASLVLGGAWGDFDRDGFVDLFLAEFSPATTVGEPPDLAALPGAANALLRNRGDGTFADATATSGVGGAARRSTTAAWVDFNRDGWLDVYVTNYGQPAEALRNNGDGSFTDVAAALGLADGARATCQAWEDLDRDGRLDLYVGHEDGVPDGTWLARADGTFENISGQHGLAASAPGHTWACHVFDYDADGDMDVVALHGGLGGAAQRATLMMNRLDEGPEADPRFVDVTPEAGDHDVPGYEAFDTIATPLAWSGAGLLDWSLVGAPSLAAAGNPRDSGGDTPDVERLRLVKNFGWTTWTGNGNYFKVLLDGAASNAAGLGATVTVQAGAITVVRQLGAAMAWGGASLTEAQFGLMKPDEGGYRGQARPVNVTIAWPSGQVDVHRGVFGVQRYVRFTEGGGWQNDSLAPRPQLALTAGSPGLNGWYRSDVTFKLSAVDRSAGGSDAKGTRSLRYSLDGTTWTPVPSPNTGVSLTFAHEGTRRLWVETTDRAGDTPGWSDNTAVFLYPIRIDRAEATVDDLTPRPGEVHAQGRPVAALPPEVPVAMSVVAAPVAFAAPDASGPEVQVALDGVLGSDGRQGITVEVHDNVSGVWMVWLDVDRPDGDDVPNSTAFLRLPPFTWRWRAGEAAAGVYDLNVRAWDFAGNLQSLTREFVLVPSGPEGWTATVRQGPSLPTAGAPSGT